jgi:hypothetical protein
MDNSNKPTSLTAPGKPPDITPGPIIGTAAAASFSDFKHPMRLGGQAQFVRQNIDG